MEINEGVFMLGWIDLVQKNKHYFALGLAQNNAYFNIMYLCNDFFF
jgi:hypothetical protein